MLTEIFGENCKRTMVLEILITHPYSEYTKKDIADSAGISRTTLDTFIDKLLEVGIIKKTAKIKNGYLYQINLDSPITKALDSFQNQLADIEIKKQMEIYSKETGKDIKPIKPFEELVKKEIRDKGFSLTSIPNVIAKTVLDLPNQLIYPNLIVLEGISTQRVVAVSNFSKTTNLNESNFRTDLI